MKDSTSKTLLNYSTSLTNIASKKLETAKSPEDRVNIISKQFEDIRKKVAEVIEKGEPIKSEGESVVKLEFDKLNKRLDIIEATEYANNNFIMGLMKGATNSESSDDSDSLSDQLSRLFGFDGDGKLEFDEIIGLFTKGGLTSSMVRSGLSDIKGVGKFLLNPYVAIPLAAIAGSVILMNKLIEKVNDVGEKLDNNSKNAFGTTSGDVSRIIDTTKDSYGFTKSDYDKLLSDPDLSDKDKEIYLVRRSELEKTIVDEVSSTILSNIVNESDVSKNAATLATDPSKSNSNDKYTMSLTDRVLSSLIIDSRKTTLATNDLANLGEYGMSARDVMHDINQSYINILSINVSKSEVGNTPKYREFDWSNPILSIKRIAIDYSILKHDTSEDSINKYYNILFKDFIAPIELNKESIAPATFGQGNRWDTITSELGESRKDEDGRSIYYLPTLGNIGDSNNTTIYGIYYPPKIKFKDNKEYASRMTIAQQYEILGKNLESSPLKDSTNIYTFLPVRINIKYANYSRDIKLNDSDRLTINKAAIIRAVRIENGRFSDTDTMEDLLGNEESLVTEYEANLNILSQIDSALDFNQSYDRDSTIVSSINNLGIDIDSDIGKLMLDSLNSWDGQLKGSEYDNMISELSEKTGIKSGKLKSSFKSISNYKLQASTHKLDIISSLKTSLGSKYNEEFFDRLIEILKKDPSLLNLYRNKDYKNLARKLGFDELDINNSTRFDKVRSIIDRIMRYYQLYSYNDEGGNDLDGLIATFIPTDEGVIGDLSSSVDLFGLGTADEIISSGLMTKDKLKEFLKSTLDKKLESTIINNEDGSPKLDYHRSGYTNDSESVKSAVLEALAEIGWTPESVSQSLDAQVATAEGVSAVLLTGNKPTESNQPDASSDSAQVEL